MNDLNDDQKLMIYALGTLEELRAKGLIKGGTALSPGGAAVYEKLKATGYEPNGADLSEALLMLKSEGLAPDVTDLGRQVDSYLDERDL